MTPPEPIKSQLHQQLQRSRENLVWKLDGLPERELRLPRTPTGTNLLGMVKHVAGVEAGYFGEVFDRPWPHPELVGEDRFDVDPQADWYATGSETAEGIIGLYRDVWQFADATIDSLPLDAPGTVPHWPGERAQVTLGQIMVHVLVDLTRHVGQADVLREHIDGVVGMRPANSNVPDGIDWPDYVAKLERIAEGF